MKKEAFWRNTSLQMAILAGLAVAIATYLILTSGVFATRNISSNAQKSKPKKGRIVEKNEITDGVQTEKKSRVLMALRISDYEVLKPRLRKGAKINIIYGYGEGRNSNTQVRTFMENVLIVEVPPSSNSRLSAEEQGILIEVSKEESERLASLTTAEPLRIVIKED
jgi:hypothetical protein